MILIPIKDTGKRKYGHVIWLYQCECGNIKEIRKASVDQGNTKSCGCLYKKTARKGSKCNLYKHGYRHSSSYISWANMKQRCLNKNSKDFKNYGGRGITICESWMDFENFLADMGEKPEGLTLGRKDNDGNYEPSNCRWETYEQQNNNRRI